MDDLNDYLENMDLYRQSILELAERVSVIQHENKEELENMNSDEKIEFFTKLGEHYRQELEKKISEKKKSKKRKVSKLAN